MDNLVFHPIRVYEQKPEMVTIDFKTLQSPMAVVEPRRATQIKKEVAEVTPKKFALSLVGQEEFSCLNKLWNHESGWQADAQNRYSGAYGIPQAYPGSKMASAGKDWKTNPFTQIKWGIKYINNRYGSSCKAWEFWNANHWY